MLQSGEMQAYKVCVLPKDAQLAGARLGLCVSVNMG